MLLIRMPTMNYKSRGMHIINICFRCVFNIRKFDTIKVSLDFDRRVKRKNVYGWCGLLDHTFAYTHHTRVWEIHFCITENSNYSAFKEIKFQANGMLWMKCIKYVYRFYCTRWFYFIFVCYVLVCIAKYRKVLYDKFKMYIFQEFY